MRECGVASWRRVPLAPQLASKLRGAFDAGSDQLLFPSRRNTPFEPDNLGMQMLQPLVEEIGAPWAGWHALRHSYASIQVASGVNIVPLSRTLGRHSAAFTLSRYAHLFERDEARALNMSALVFAPARPPVND